MTLRHQPFCCSAPLSASFRYGTFSLFSGDARVAFRWSVGRNRLRTINRALSDHIDDSLVIGMPQASMPGCKVRGGKRHIGVLNFDIAEV